MRAKKCGNHRGRGLQRPYTLFSKYPNIPISYGISQGKKQFDDFRPIRKCKIQARKPTLLVQRILCRYGR